MKKNPFRIVQSPVGLYVREIIGWILLALGLTFFYESLKLIKPSGGYVPLVVEGFIAAFMGFVVFRGGLQLVKVAIAARVVRPEPKAVSTLTSESGSAR